MSAWSLFDSFLLRVGPALGYDRAEMSYSVPRQAGPGNRYHGPHLFTELPGYYIVKPCSGELGSLEPRLKASGRCY